MSKLTARQQLFCDFLLLDKSRISIAAYYKAYPHVTKKTTAEVNASRLLSMDKIQAYLAKANIARSERTNIDADWMMRELAAIHNMQVDDVLHDDGSVKPVSEWSDIWKKMVSAFEIHEMDGEQAAIIIKKIKLPDKQVNLKMIGNHIDVQAFKEKTELTGPNGQPLSLQLLSNAELDAKIKSLLSE